MFSSALSRVLIAITCVVVAGCATAPTSEPERTQLLSRADEVVVQAKQNDPSLKTFFDSAVGYAVFPSVGKGGVGVGGAYGRGILYEAGKPVGYCDLSQGSIGFQLGGQVYSELVFFEQPQALQQFKDGRFEFAAQATAVAVHSGAGANARYSSGVAVFTMGESGLMYEASIGGQQFSYMPMQSTTQPAPAPANP